MAGARKHVVVVVAAAAAAAVVVAGAGGAGGGAAAADFAAEEKRRAARPLSPQPPTGPRVVQQNNPLACDNLWECLELLGNMECCCCSFVQGRATEKSMRSSDLTPWMCSGADFGSAQLGLNSR